MTSGRNRDKILIIRLSALGDVAMTLPVIYSACTAYPDADFYMLTRPFFANLFINPPANLHIITADFKTEYKGMRGMQRLMRRLSGYGFTAVADLHNVLRSWGIDLWLKMRGVKVRMVNKDRKSRRSANRSKCTQESYIDRYCEVFASLGYPLQLTFGSLYDKSRPTLPEAVAHPAVGIAPFARYTNKTYPIEQMEQAVKILTSKGVNIYLFGGRGAEAEMLNRWAEQYPLCHSLAGKMPISDELTMMSDMDVMVSMDSANQHLAALAGTKVITIWGSTAPICGFTAFRQPTERSLLLDLPCQPCTTAGSEKCRLGTLACLRQLSPLTIVDRIMGMLADRQY